MNAIPVRVLLLCFVVVLAACTDDRVPGSSGKPAQQAVPPNAPADIVLENGYVYTVDPARRVAEAVAIRGNRIIAVGATKDLATLVGAATEVRDLHGRMVMPGIHDTHIHAIGTVDPDMCDFKGEARSLEEMVPFLRACLDRYAPAPGEWMPVVQWPFSRGNQPSKRYPSLRAALDAVSTEHPIILWGDDGHHGAANSAALALARDPSGNVVGINRQTLDGVFARWREHVAVDEHGEPSGGINEGARLLVRPEFMQDMLGVGADPAKTMPRVAAMLASRGITSIQDPYVVPESLKMYEWLEDSGRMSFRLRAGLYHHAPDSHSAAGLARIPAYIESFKRLRSQYADSKYIRADGVKLFADAVLEGNPYTQPPTLPVAAVLNGFKQPIFTIDEASGRIEDIDYVDLDGAACRAVRAAPQEFEDAAARAAFAAANGFLPAQCSISSGVLEHSEEFIHAFVRQATEAGFHVHIHALSDRGVRVAVDALAEVKELADSQGLTQSLAHVQLAHPDDQRRIGELGLYVAFTYAWMIPDIEYDLMVIPFIEQVDGIADLFDPDTYYLRNVYPVKRIRDFGGVLTFGSDAPVDTRDPIPFVSMEQALTRAEGDRVLNASQRIGIHDALEAYTINGARLLSHDEQLGSIEPGKLADLIVLDQNVVELAEQGAADRISDTKVLLTIFDGRIVYDAHRP